MPNSIIDARSCIRFLVVTFTFDIIVALAGSDQQILPHFITSDWRSCTFRRYGYSHATQTFIFTPSRISMKLSMPEKSSAMSAENTATESESSLDMNNYVEVTDSTGAKSLVSTINGEDGNVYQFIRLEKEPTLSTMNDISSLSNIKQKIRNVENSLAVYGQADMYIREWEDCTEDSNRTVFASPPRATFSTLQFNALAEGLSSCPRKTPFSNDNNVEQRSPAGYGGFTSIPQPSVILDFEQRKWRLVEIILGRNLDTPYDIIAIEEIDRYHGFFGPLLRRFDYNCIFTPKKNSPSARLGWYSDGCVLAWKSNMFNLLHEQIGDYSVGNQVFIVATLQHVTSHQVIIVAVTHLKAQQNESNEVIRCRQVEELLEAIDNEVRRLKSFMDNENIQVIVLGDFNADPPSQTGFDYSAINRVLNHKIPLLDTFYHSAYDIDTLSDDRYTSWKIRGTKVSKRLIDYIFYAGSSIRCVATLKAVNHEEVEETRLPGLRYPSDHLHIAAKFNIN